MPVNRKFADIEAANHRLASALYLKEAEKNPSGLSPEERDAVDRPDGPAPDAPLQAPDKSSARPAEAAASTCSDALFNSGEHDPSVKKDSAAQKQEEETDELVEITPTDVPAAHRPSARGRPHNSPAQPVRDIPGDSPVAQPDSGFIEFLQGVDTDPAAPPGLGLLPPEPCDLSIQMFPGASTCAQGPKTIADIAESQWSEIMDLLGGGYAEVEAYLESVCACRGDAGPEVESAEFGFMDVSDSFPENLAETVFEGGRLREDGHGCLEPPGGFHAGLGVLEQQLPGSLGYQGDASEPQAYQHPREEGCCVLGSNPNFTPFEGVAQSFTVPLHYVKPRAIPTPPHEEDWPFTDILEDRTSACG